MLRHAVVKLLRGLLSLLRLALSPLRRVRHREQGPRLLALRGFASPQAVCFIDPLPRKAPEHKDEMIDTVLQVYPDLPAVLVGDSGQHDPEVYAGLAERHPGRIAAVYIRDLEQSAARTKELAKIGEGLRRQGINFVSGSDSRVLAQHASQRGWMSGGIRRQTRVAPSAGDA